MEKQVSILSSAERFYRVKGLYSTKMMGARLVVKVKKKEKSIQVKPPSLGSQGV